MYDEITVRQFMNALFRNDRSVMNDKQFKTCYDEYVDTTGLYETDIFNKECYIQFLTTRINVIAIGIKLHSDFVEEFGKPYVSQLKIFNQYGHFPLWKNDKDKFLKDLTRIGKLEKVYISQLEAKVKELEEIKSKNVDDKPMDINKSRGNFIQTLNSLGKVGYKIEKDNTTVEELAYMIKYQLEENKKRT